MKYVILNITLFLAGILVLFSALWFTQKHIDNKSYRVYNCDLVEISPDFPLEVKKKCRELRHENRNMQ